MIIYDNYQKYETGTSVYAYNQPIYFVACNSEDKVGKDIPSAAIQYGIKSIC
jgi:hypothetical protein